ncbi:hypothetical protein [uncultured Pontibacter sp.]|uniref:hypothetical protein n=1 Tax=uncultured Pontibacter sp. TaxID=453356 RepID=UPI00262C3EFB|nr:hypothetical protein [uncultured Pontibacter sp.]
MISPILVHLLHFNDLEFHNIDNIKRNHDISDSQVMELEDDGYIELPFIPVFNNPGELPAEEEQGARLTTEGKYFVLSRMIMKAIKR